MQLSVQDASGIAFNWHALCQNCSRPNNIKVIGLQIHFHKYSDQMSIIYSKYIQYSI